MNHWAPAGFRKAQDGQYVAERVVYLPTRNPLTGKPYEAAFKAQIVRWHDTLWILSLARTSDPTDKVEISEHASLNAAAQAADKAGWL